MPRGPHSPIPRLDELPGDLWDRPSPLRGVSFDREAQVRRLQALAPRIGQVPPIKDFQPVNLSQTFAASTRGVLKRITVQGVQDTLDEENEVFNLWAKTACGVLSLVTGIAGANADKNAGGKDFALPVLNNP